MSKKLLAFVIFLFAFHTLFYYGFSGYSFFFYTLTMSALIFLNRKPGHNRLAHLLLGSNLALSLWEATHVHSLMAIVNSLASTLLLGLTWACYRDDLGSLLPSLFRLGIETLHAGDVFSAFIASGWKAQ